jgi:ABC-type branched-subunit amino acid transport system ATPase component
MSLRVEGLTAGYGAITVLRGVTFEVATGSIIAVLGRNGMGKTTLVRALSGLIPATSGRILLGDTDVTRFPAHERAAAGFATVVQGRGIFPRLTVRENLTMGRIASGRPKPDRLEEVLGYFPRLEERLNQSAGTMSGGEQQMLAIGCGLMTDPKTMLLDEPSDGIMPTLVQQIAVTLAKINQERGMTILVVEQNIPMVMKMAAHFIVIEKGRLVAQHSRAEVGDGVLLHDYLAI